MMYWNGGGSWWWLIPMMLCTIALITLVVGVLVALARSGTLRGRATAEDILRERFARGELDATAYAHTLDVLRGPRSTASP